MREVNKEKKNKNQKWERQRATDVSRSRRQLEKHPGTHSKGSPEGSKEGEKDRECVRDDKSFSPRELTELLKNKDNDFHQSNRNGWSVNCWYNREADFVLCPTLHICGVCESVCVFYKTQKQQSRKYLSRRVRAAQASNGNKTFLYSTGSRALLCSRVWPLTSWYRW